MQRADLPAERAGNRDVHSIAQIMEHKGNLFLILGTVKSRYIKLPRTLGDAVFVRLREPCPRGLHSVLLRPRRHRHRPDLQLRLGAAPGQPEPQHLRQVGRARGDTLMGREGRERGKKREHKVKNNIDFFWSLLRLQKGARKLQVRTLTYVRTWP